MKLLTNCPNILRAIDQGRLSENDILHLLANRISDAIADLRPAKEPGQRVWFVSHTAKKERHRVTIQVSPLSSELPLIVEIVPAFDNVANIYFRQIESRLQPYYYDLYRSIKGHKDVLVRPKILLKIHEKHRLNIQEVLEAAENFNGRFFHSRDPVSRLERNTFFILATRPSQLDLKIVFLENSNGDLELISAYEVNQL